MEKLSNCNTDHVNKILAFIIWFLRERDYADYSTNGQNMDYETGQLPQGTLGILVSLLLSLFICQAVMGTKYCFVVVICFSTPDMFDIDFSFSAINGCLGTSESGDYL